MTGKFPIPLQRSARFAVGMVLGVGVFSTVVPSAYSQTASPQPLQDFQTKDSTDIFSNRGGSQGPSIMNFINNAILGTNRDPNEYASDQRENFDDAAAQFRKQQAERIRMQQQQTNPATPILEVGPMVTPGK